MATQETSGIFAQKANVNTKMCFMTEFIITPTNKHYTVKSLSYQTSPSKRRLLKMDIFSLDYLGKRLSEHDPEVAL